MEGENTLFLESHDDHAGRWTGGKRERMVRNGKAGGSMGSEIHFCTRG